MKDLKQGCSWTILALDLGTSSVGWALFSIDGHGEPIELLDLGVRHFEEVVVPKSGELKNLKRRQARGMRKNLRRRRQRRDNLLNALRSAGLAPEGAKPYAESEKATHEPDRLRATGVSERLELHEIGRALFHLARRRGFKSNRGAKLASIQSEPEVAEMLASAEEAEPGEAQTEEQQEEGKVLEEIKLLREQLGKQTLGQFLWSELEAGRKVRGRHADRAMYEDEFERLWRAQAAFHPGVFTEELKSRIHYAIFHQRPLKVQKFLKTTCTLEPTKVRAERAQLVAQRFRYWQDLCNILLTHLATGERRPLTLDEKLILAGKLETQASMKWSAIRKALKLSPSWEFNLERAKHGELKGNGTAARLAGRSPELWAALDDCGKEGLVEMLLTIDDRGKLYRALRKKYDIEPGAAYRLATLELEAGTASLSSRAMRKILPFMESGFSRIEAQIKAGYEPWEDEIQPVAKLANAPGTKEIPSPRVRKALGQVRKVVNAIAAEYGRPAIIRIEMARDLSLTKDEKKGRDKANKELQKLNREAEEWYLGQGVERPSREAKIWYRLAKQCGWVCPYTGQAIPQEAASSSRFQIEHIVPFVLSIDDSFNNLTLCEAETNRKKGNRTPYQAFGNTPEWPNMVARAGQWKGFGTGHKKRLFRQQVLPDEEKMAERQLNETRWICKAAAAYLGPICGEVQATKGQATAMLRKHWGLMTTLHDAEEKTRDDLRHHAVDAVAIAFTSRSVFQKATKARKRAVEGGSEVDLTVRPLSDETVPPAPAWLHGQVAARLESMVVSHEPTRGIQDAFHKETAMGLRSPAEGLYHFRKPLASMTEGELKSIVDPGIRRLALEAFQQAGRDSAKAFAEGLDLGTSTARRARITKAVPKAPMLGLPKEAPHKFFELGNNHHVEIFEQESTGKRQGRWISTLEAATRVRQERRPLVDTTPPAPGWRFVMWLAANDVVRVDDDPRGFFRVQKSSNNKIVFRAIRASGVDNDDDRLMKSPNTLNAVKVSVDALGRVRELPEGVV